MSSLVRTQSNGFDLRSAIPIECVRGVPLCCASSWLLFALVVALCVLVLCVVVAALWVVMSGSRGCVFPLAPRRRSQLTIEELLPAIKKPDQAMQHLPAVRLMEMVADKERRAAAATEGKSPPGPASLTGVCRAPLRR